MEGDFVVIDADGTALTLTVTDGMVLVYDENDQPFELPVTELYS